MSVKHLPARQTQRVKYSDNVVGKEGLISGQSLEAASTDIATLKEDVATMKAGTFSSGLSVTGSVETTGSIKAGADLEATGDATVDGDIEASGHLKSSDSVITPKLTTTGDSIEAEKPVIEKMTGYSFVPDAGAVSPVVVFKYIGVVKTGNKLTFAMLVELTPNENWAANSGHRLGKYIVPSDIFSALKTTNIGGLDAVSVKKCHAYSSINTDVSMDLYFQRLNSGEISPVLYPDSQMDQGTKYTLRTELTFLLSESLVE